MLRRYGYLPRSLIFVTNSTNPYIFALEVNNVGSVPMQMSKTEQEQEMGLHHKPPSWKLLWYWLTTLLKSFVDNVFHFHCTGLAVRYMSCDVRPICPVVKERVSLVSGVYTGDAFELGVFIWKFITSSVIY
jgi:hypothetical protein